jgi:hypothetical protein
MAKAFKCDHCKELTEKANGADIFYPKRVRVDIKYGHPVNGKPYDLCLECRVSLLKHIIQGIEAKEKYTWADLKDPEKVAELL